MERAEKQREKIAKRLEKKPGEGGPEIEAYREEPAPELDRPIILPDQTRLG